MSQPESTPLLEARQLRKSFPGVVALDAVDFSLGRGEIHALVGENGAGKSTLIKLLTGAARGDGGQMRLQGAPFAPADTAAAQRAGVSGVFQEVNLLPNLTVALSRRGVAPRVLEKILGGNVLRVLDAVPAWGSLAS